MVRRWIAAAALSTAALAALMAIGCLDAPPDSRSDDRKDAAAADDGSPGDLADAAPDCVDPGAAPGGTCTSDCDNCTATICSADCNGGPGCHDTMTCPEGLDCDVSCESIDACIGLVVDCPPKRNCVVLCAGDDACMNLVLNCTDGPCGIQCTGDPQACIGVTVNCGSGPCGAECPLEGSDLPDVVCGASCACAPC